MFVYNRRLFIHTSGLGEMAPVARGILWFRLAEADLVEKIREYYILWGHRDAVYMKKLMKKVASGVKCPA